MGGVSSPDVSDRIRHVFRVFRSDLRSLADEDLMVLIHDGESRALEVIFDRHGDRAYSLAYRMCGRTTVAEDIVQEAFLSLWRSGTRYDPTRGSVRTWVLTAVRNRAIDVFRRESVATGRDVADDQATARLPSDERTEFEVERREDARRIRAALETLPDEQRKVIELAYFGGFSHTEIARTLGVPAGTVKGRMRLGLTKLRVALGDPSEVTR
jgi:RNA polymerase sigma-70 factor, ECF subfamily